jgi:SynChlorMet cassette radical SAM/SPASM protein ScmF
MSILARNAGQIEAVVRLAEEIGAASVKFNLIQPTARGARIHESRETPEIPRLIEIGRWVDGELSKTTRLSLHYDIPAAFRPLSRLARADEQCGILTVLGLLSTGHYALCGIGMHTKELVFGTVGVDNIADIWRKHHVLREIRQGMGWRLAGICSRCLVRDICKGACLAQNYYGSGALWGPYWFCRDAERMGLFPPARLAALSERPDGRRRQEE